MHDLLLWNPNIVRVRNFSNKTIKFNQKIWKEWTKKIPTCDELLKGLLFLGREMFFGKSVDLVPNRRCDFRTSFLAFDLRNLMMNHSSFFSINRTIQKIHKMFITHQFALRKKSKTTLALNQLNVLKFFFNEVHKFTRKATPRSKKQINSFESRKKVGEKI